MGSYVPSRADGWALLCQFNQSDKAIKHALAVEAAMRYFARQQGQDEEKWAVIGLVHDLDYEQFPDQHCAKTRQLLSERSWPEEYIRAVVSHGWPVFSEAQPQTDLEKTLYAVDELTGLVAAAALVRPSKSIMDLEVRSVKKKWKEKSFAAGVDRTVIERGAAMLGLELEKLIEGVILGMRSAAKELGLAGQGG